MSRLYSLAASKFKHYKKLLCLLAVAFAGYWAFSYYVIVPVCAENSKSVTMYLAPHQDNPSKDTVSSRTTFRIPSAYLHTVGLFPRGGRQNAISVSLDIETFKPACLLVGTQSYGDRLLYLVLRPVSPAHFQEYMISEQTGSNERIEAEKGFIGYHRKGAPIDFLIPKQHSDTPIFFKCIKKNDSYAPDPGCTGEVMYKKMAVQFTFRRRQLNQWQEIQGKAIKFIDSIIVILL